MKIFDFLKKRSKTNSSKETVKEKLAFSEIDNWIENKIKENELKEKEIPILAKKKIQDLIKEIREKIIILRDFNVDAKKEKDRIKNIVKDSKEKYIESVEDLIEKLNNLEESKLERFIEKINKIFFDFNKSSFKNYERATILIGKEIASLRESLKVFSKSLLKVFEEGKPIMDSSKNLLKIREKLNTLNPINKILKNISEEKLKSNNKINEKEEESKTLKQNLKNIKTSTTYLENLNQQKRIESFESELKKEILELKQLLDFKILANFFHINQQQMKMIKELKEDFYKFFLEDNGKSILNLLDEAKLNKDKIKEKIININSKLKEIISHKKNLKEDLTKEIYLKIKEVNLEIEALKIENIKEEKRGERLKINKEELVNSLIQDFGKMNIEVR